MKEQIIDIKMKIFFAVGRQLLVCTTALMRLNLYLTFFPANY